MELDDRVELHELPGRYGDLIDERDWIGLDRIFCEEATFQVSDFVMEGLDAIRAYMDNPLRRHPRTHLMANIYVDEPADAQPGEAAMRFRLIGMRPDGKMISVRYRDVVRKEPQGWRVLRRVVEVTPRAEPAEEVARRESALQLDADRIRRVGQ